MSIVVNSVGAVASLMGFALAIHLLLKGSPSEKSQRHKRAITYICVGTLSAILVIIMSISLKKDIITHTQSDDFANFPQGTHEIYYGIPYQRPPFLRIDLIDRNSRGGSVKILEQRADGFCVELDSLANHWQWKASGTPIDQRN